ncbi:MAG TPA: 50S ribosomal protein L23 [Candidatus Omnitrophota bacterium]|jgi:large subunit ribosomal protein L23|nr:MAG: 50S ribosomal protein L23 [Candidatus Omnitrophica bacterium ADurb.Bin314]HOE68266.1 50S ribosomal protein L23 [Candidatus Omnitrophota bacterium]HPW65276.1 50S ribosomal protein L23 [Candidatus Omnitrophota bacterium]HQB93816.1 50S ribosomal protein L23 [Candidatus Omnitrophota bacterium]
MGLMMYDIILEPLITEKIARATESANQYGFKVHPKANKKEIKSAVEKIFNVHVESVNTVNVDGKWRRVRYQPGQTPDWKKAIVTLKKGEKIDLTK